MSALLWVLVTFFFVGYLVLEGANFGVGMRLVRGDLEYRNRLARAISPRFLGSEVWLVAAAGLLTAAFPKTEAARTPDLYPVIVTILLGWMVRDAGLWFRGRWRPEWCDRAVALGSFVLAGGWGFALVRLVTGTVWWPLLTAVAAVVVAWLYGGTFLAGFRPAAAVGAVIAAAAAVVLLTRQPPHAAGSTTLILLAAFVLPALPFLLAAQVWLWRACRRPVSQPGFF